MATRDGSAQPWPVMYDTASIRSSCILPPHSRSPAATNAFPYPVEPR